MNYFFSIIIPVFNSEKFLINTITSVLNQNFTNYEIILINDSSTDKTKEICLKFSKNYNHIKLINLRKNHGVGFCRNLALNKSLGKYLIFLDSDDKLYKDSLESLKNLIKTSKNPDMVILHYTKTTFPKSNYNVIRISQKYNFSIESLIKYIQKMQFPFADCWSFSVKNSFVKKNKIYFSAVRIGESELFVSRMICLMKSYSSLSKKFYDKNDRDNSLNHTSGFEAARSSLKLLLDLYDFSANFKGLKKIFYNSYIQDAFGIFSSLLIVMNNNEIRNLSYLIKKNVKNITRLTKYPEKIPLVQDSSRKDNYQDLQNFRKKIIKSKIDIIDNIEGNHINVYLYCRSKYTASTIKCLQETQYKIKAIVDDNEIYNGTYLEGYLTINSDKLFNEIKSSKDKLLILITHQRTKTLKKISKSLINKGLKENQIHYIKY